MPPNKEAIEPEKDFRPFTERIDWASMEAPNNNMPTQMAKVAFDVRAMVECMLSFTARLSLFPVGYCKEESTCFTVCNSRVVTKRELCEIK